MTTPTNPATFSKEVIDTIRPITLRESKKRLGILTILDPFAGTGGIHDLYKDDPPSQIAVHTFGVELEPEWANQHSRTQVGNVLDLRFTDRAFDACVTSPCYGNRMADHHDAQERCKACKGTGFSLAESKVFCEKCGGEGRRHYKRNTYRHHLGRGLSVDSAAGLQWGPQYRTFHEEAWAEVSRVVDDLFVLNCKDHYRKGVEQAVTAWHVETLEGLGWRVAQDWIPVKTPGNGFGANRDLRSDNEWVVIFRR